jgi:hypothetical protein
MVQRDVGAARRVRRHRMFGIETDRSFHELPSVAPHASARDDVSVQARRRLWESWMLLATRIVSPPDPMVGFGALGLIELARPIGRALRSCSPFTAVALRLPPLSCHILCLRICSFDVEWNRKVMEG